MDIEPSRYRARPLLSKVVNSLGLSRALERNRQVLSRRSSAARSRASGTYLQVGEHRVTVNILTMYTYSHADLVRIDAAPRELSNHTCIVGIH